MDVFQLIGRGLSNRHIAQELSLSVKTVETYRSRIIEKLKMKDSSELVRYASPVEPGERSKSSIDPVFTLRLQHVREFPYNNIRVFSLTANKLIQGLHFMSRYGIYYRC